MNKLFPTIAMITAAWALPALALDLQTARTSGAVGEKTDGYIAAVQSSAEVNALVSEVNGKRQAEYARISKQNGQPVNVVAKLAAEQIISGLPAGAMYQDTSGNWKKR
ncbi:MAG: YdbL family protein [Rickettsiales bacterium]|nr:YdbL family protein [Rickettsiales bacterium]